MTVEQLSEYIKNHRPLNIRYADKKSYKIGLNSAIFQCNPKPEPDNRVPFPIVRRALHITKGYMAKPGNIQYIDQDPTLKEIYDQNDEALRTASILEDSLCFGSGFELHWYNREKGFMFYPIPIDQCIPIYSDDLIQELTGFIWLRTNNTGKELATFYDDKEQVDYEREKSQSLWIETSRQFHGYESVPVLEAITDRDKRNMFDHVLPLLDLFDKIMSEVGNEHEKFAESVLLLRDAIDTVTKDESGLTQADKLEQWRILDRLGDNIHDSADYLQRNVNDTFINNTLDRFERYLYEMLCIFNPNDDNFSTASGIAQAYKLLGFEYFVANIESYFSQFLYARLRLIGRHKVNNISIDTLDKITLRFVRNLPFNVLEASQIASTLQGLVSQDTILRMFEQMIPDIEEEKKKIEEEKENSMSFEDVDNDRIRSTSKSSDTEQEQETTTN